MTKANLSLAFSDWALGAGRLDATQRLAPGRVTPIADLAPQPVVSNFLANSEGFRSRTINIRPPAHHPGYGFREAPVPSSVPFALFGQKVRRNKVRTPRQRVSLVSGFFIDSSSLINAEKEKLRGFCCYIARQSTA
jgi:hypothetical protein